MREKCVYHLAICLILCFSFAKDLGGTPSKAAEVITSYE